MSTENSTLPAPEFSGHDAHCVKCGSRAGIAISYRPFRPTLIGGEEFDISRCVSPTTQLDECLLRTCQECGWAWIEACADAPPNVAPMNLSG